MNVLLPGAKAIVYRLGLFILFSGLNMFSASAFTIVDGYMDKISYKPGDTARIYLNSSIVIRYWKLYLLNIEGTRKDSVIINLVPQGISMPQPWINGFGYSQTFSYIIPQNLQSGIYNWADKVFFIVKNPLKNAEITIVYPSNTEAAYNNAGGKGLYDFNSPGGRAAKVTFKRPLSGFIINEVRTYCKRFLEWMYNQPGFTIQYIADTDLDNYSEIQQTRIVVVPGHSEYWSREARLNLDQFVNSGKDAIILSGNTMWWQVRYSDDKSELICYKDANTDPEPNRLLKTINWPDTSLHYPPLTSIGVDFIHGAYGMKPYHGWYGYKILEPDSPLLEGTGLSWHDVVSCQSKEYDATLFYGFESNGDPIIDTTTLGFCKIELIGYDWGKSIYYYGPPKSYGTFIAFKKTPSSGNIINVGFTNWCAKQGGQGAEGGFGGKDSTKIKLITLNMLNKLLAGKNIYAKTNHNCTTTGVEETFKGEDPLIVFPNPGNGEFHVKSSRLSGGDAGVELYNALGIMVFTQKLGESDQYGFNVSFLPGGIYYYRITRPQEVAGSGKIIISH